MTALTAVQEGVSARDSYIKWVDYTAYERNTIFDGLYFADMMDDSMLSVTLDVLRNDDNIYIQKKLLPLLVSEGEYTEAETLLNTIKETDNSSLYIIEQEAKLIMNCDAIGFYELPESLKDALAQYWIDAPQQSSWSAMQAGVHSWQYYINPHLITTDTENNKWDGVQDDPSKKEVKETNFLVCYPNPTTNNSGIIKGYYDSNQNSKIIIYNSLGQLIAQYEITNKNFELNITLPAKGMYMIVLQNNGTVINQQKWVVQ